MRHLCEDCIARREAEAGAAARYKEFRRKMARDDAAFWGLVLAGVALFSVLAIADSRETSAYLVTKAAATRAKSARAPGMYPAAETWR